MGAFRRFERALSKGSSVRRALVSGAALASLMAMLLPPAAPVSAEPSSAPLLDGVPNLTISAPGSVSIGAMFNLTVTFDNTSATDTGYGPFIDLIFPVNGADGAAGTDTPDGIDFTGATYLGAAVTSVDQVFPDSGGGFGCVNHPYARDTSGAFIQVCGTAGDKLVVLLLPFGSFTPTQPQAVVSVGASLSDLADLGTPLTIRARGGFRFGNSPLDDWCCDPVILLPASNDGTGWPSTGVTPTLISITKTYSGPEDETATGPDYPRQYTITVTVAPGQTVTDLDVTDDLPNNLAFLSVDTISPAGSIVQTPTVGAAANPPNNRLVVNVPSVSDITGPATVTISFFVPRLDANGSPVIPPLSGADATSANRAGAVGDWTPVDTRDAGGVNNAIAGGVCPACAILHTLNDRSIAIQKSVTIATDTGPAGASPGDRLANTLQFQISDYFAFDGLVLTDTFSDGQLWDSGTEPTLSLTEHGSSTSDELLPANYTVVHNTPGAGTTTVTFRVSDELVSRSRDAAALGGCVPPGGTGGPPPDCTSFNAGATAGTLVFYTVIQDQFTDTYPSGDPSVDQGDVLGDNVTIDGDLLDTADLDPLGSSEADGSSGGVSIPRGEPDKSIYAVNGVVCAPQPCTGVEIDPGDTLTFRVQYGLPTSDFEDLYLIDFLPLPVLDATEVTAFDAIVSAAAPVAGRAKFGPADTFYASRPPASNIVPAIATDPVGNSVQFTYGRYDDPSVPPPSTAVDILFTVTVSNDPFTDRLLLTNQLRVHEGSTNSTDVDGDNIVQFTLREPFLVVKKGVIATDQTVGIFDPFPVGPVSFSAPGTAGTRFTPPIDSSDLTTNPVDSDLSGVDAVDLISFAITIENQGSSPGGAFDIVITDTLQPGFVIPAGGLNLTVTRGDGSAVAFLGAPASLFGAGIELVDPGSGPGVCEAHSLTSGRNIIVITYDLQVDPSAEPGQVITNTAEVTNYAGEEGGEDHTGTGPNPAFQDEADVTIASPVVVKTVLGTNQVHTSGINVAIGEVVQYQAITTIPEGTMTAATLVDTLDAGLAFVGLDSLTTSPGLSTDVVGGFPQVLANAQAALAAPGSSATFDFGTLTNGDTVNTTPETVTLTYTVAVLNSIGNDRGVGRNNNAAWAWTSGTAAGTAPDVVIAEPTLQVTKTAVPTTGDAGDTISFAVVISHTGASNTDAFEVAWSDIVPAGMTYTPGTLSNTAGLAPTTIDDTGAPTLVATWTALTGFPLASTSTLTFDVTLDAAVSPGQVITNTADAVWTSLPGDVTAPQSPYNGVSTERTGDTANPGGAENDYRGTGSAAVTVFAQPEKFFVSTSESSTGFVTGFERVTIGEVIRYRLVFRLAESRAINFQLQDQLPGGLLFIDDGSAMVAFVTNDPAGGITSSTLVPAAIGCNGVAGNPNLDLTGDETTVAGLTPECPLPDLAVSRSATVEDDAYVSGDDAFFKLGNLTNDDRDPDQELILVEFNVAVSNIAGNGAYNNATGATLSQVTRTNNFRSRIGNPPGVVIGPDSNNISVRISEPVIFNLVKAVSLAPSDAGDAVQYTMTFSNSSSGIRAATAFDVRVVDALDANLALGTVAVTAPGYAIVVDASAPPTVDVTINELRAGDSVTVTVNATVVNNAPMGATIPNTANLTYTSLPGGNGTSPNPTGSTTPGVPGSATGERTGADGVGGLNDYVDSASVSLSLVDPAITKTVFGTSVLATGSAELDPAIDDLVVGEEVTFRITVTLPEGVAPITISDDLPTVPPDQGVLGIVRSEVIAIGNRISGSALAVGAPGVHSDTDADTFLDRAVFTFGNLTNTPDGVVDDEDRITVEVVARLANIGANQAGDRLTDTATADWGLDSNSATADVETVEPLLTITKTASDDTPALGQTITYTLTVSHASGSTADAQDVVVSDTVPGGLTFEPLSAGAPIGWTADESLAPTLSFRGSLTQAVGSVAFTYQATLGVPPAVLVGQTITNTAGTTWTSISGPDANERTGTGIGPNDYATTAAETVTASEIDLSLTKDDGGISAVPGQTYAYTLTIRNIGNVNATGVTVTDTVPPYTTFAGPSGPGAWSCGVGAPAGTVCTLTVGILAPAGIVPLVFSVTVDASLPVTVDQTSNTARVDDVNEPVILRGNNSDTDTTPLGAAPDLTITKDDGIDIVSPGSLLVYAIRYDNVGDQDATGVVITETVPDETTFDAAASLPTVWSSCPDGSTGGTICTVAIGDLAAGTGGNLAFAVRVDDPVTAGTTQIVDTISIADDGTNGTDPTPADNTYTDTDNLVTLPNADLAKSLFDTNQAHTLDPAAAIGEILTYELVLTIPQGTMTSATLTDVLDLGLAFVACEDPVATGGLTTSLAGGFGDGCDLPANPTVAAEPPGAIADQGRRVTFNLGTLTNPGPGNATLTVRYTAVAIDHPGNGRGVSLNNQVTWNWVGGQLVERAADVVLVEPTLTLEKDADPLTVLPGGLVTFTLTINNVAPPSDSPAFDLVLTDTVPVEMTYVAASLAASGGGTVDDSAVPLLRVTWPVLGLNDAVTVTFQATVGSLPAGTRIRNDAYLSWSTLPGDVSAPQSTFNSLSTERVYDPPITANVVVAIPALPETGFAPGRVSELPEMPAGGAYGDLGSLVLNIPALRVSLPIVGVPAGGAGWDLTWLWDQAGYLEGTAYPTHAGNSALTAHVVLPNGMPGPFARLQDLRWGDRVIVSAYGQVYVYEVRTVARVGPNDLRPVGHKEEPWLTLVTCHTYDEAGGRYLHRVVVQAVLVEVVEE